MTLPAAENSSPNVSFERERGVYSLNVTRDVAHAVVQTADDAGRTGRISQVFRALADAEIPIFLIKMHRTALTLAMAGADCDRAREALGSIGLSITMRRDLALIAVRAASMTDLHGVIISIADALFAAGAQLLEIGDSHDSFQCLIEADRAIEAIHQLRETFKLEAAAVSIQSVETESVE